MTDLIERLRALSKHEHDDFSIGHEAAEALERLTAENAKLQELVQAAPAVAYYHEGMFFRAGSIDALQASRMTALYKAITVTQDEVRYSVWNFALAMEKKLKDNDYKGGWMECSKWELFVRANEEMTELELEMNSIDKKLKPEKVLSEAADVANFVMMIAEIEARDSLIIKPIESKQNGG